MCLSHGGERRHGGPRHGTNSTELVDYGVSIRKVDRWSHRMQEVEAVVDHCDYMALVWKTLMSIQRPAVDHRMDAKLQMRMMQWDWIHPMTTIGLANPPANWSKIYSRLVL